MPYCENCGSPVNSNAKFCGNCGKARNQSLKPTVEPVNMQTVSEASNRRQKPSYYSPPSTPVPSAAPPILQRQTYTQAPTYQAPSIYQPVPPQTSQYQTGSESIIGVIVFRKVKSLGRWDTYSGMVTSQRLIFAQMTSDMIKAAVEQAKAQAKAGGKGFLGQWSDQLKATFGYARRYLSMSPQAALAETPGNFELLNNSITEIKVKVKHNQEGQAYDLEVQIHSTQGKYEFHLDENSDYIDLLKRVYGEKVKMPFGYFNKSININI